MFHLHDETNNKFLHAGGKKDRKVEEHLTFVRLMSKQARKRSSKINQLKPLKELLGVLFDHLDKLLWNYSNEKLKTRLDKKVVSKGYTSMPGLGLSPPAHTPAWGRQTLVGLGTVEHSSWRQPNWHSVTGWQDGHPGFPLAHLSLGEGAANNSPACFSMERLLRTERTARAFGSNHVPHKQWAHHPLEMPTLQCMAKTLSGWCLRWEHAFLWYITVPQTSDHLCIHRGYLQVLI